MKLKTRKGFTLIELLIVIVIIAILVTITLLGLTKYRNSAKNAVIESGVKNTQTTCMALEATVGDYSGCTSNEADISKYVDNVSDNGGNLTIQLASPPDAFLVYSRSASDPGNLFYCADSTGIVKQLSAAPAGTDTACP